VKSGTYNNAVKEFCHPATQRKENEGSNYIPFGKIILT
jgi:hypothetical protein